jgi:phosphatidylinositol alpha-mannosyltransferase
VRIGLVCPYSLTVPGGVQVQVLGLALALRELGYEARVLGPCDGPPPYAFVTPLGNSVGAAANGSMAPIAPDPSAGLRTIRALRDEAFDVVHLHEPVAPGPTLTALLFSGAPMVGTFHRAGESGYYRAFGWLGRWATKQLAVRVAVSAEARDALGNIVTGPVEILWNGVDVDRYRLAEPWPSQGKTALFIGRHEPRKGLAVLIEAMAELPAELTLWVASEGQETARLKRLTEGDARVQWLGLISEQEKVRRIRGADVLCVPSLGGESFGVILLEGMAAGTPVVASDLDGYRNVARPGRDALMVPPGDAAALAGAVRSALAGGPDVADMVASASERAAGFSMANLAERYLDIYRRAIAMR